MGLLWVAFEKNAAAKKKPSDSSTPELYQPPPPPPWHPTWAPEAGWKTDENPSGWVRPGKENQRRELFLWDHWKKQDESPEAAEHLVKAIRGMIYKHGVQGWANRVPIAKPVLEQKALNLALKGLRTFDPTRGQLNTHVIGQFQSMNRFVKKRQNIARITEERIRLIGPVERAIARLREKLERDPTILEIADEAKIPPDTVEQLLQEHRKDNIASTVQEDPFIDETPQDRLILELVRYQLTPDEEKVFDYLTGQGGKALVTSTGEIARREGWADSKVSQIKKSIAKKIQAAR